MEGLLGQFIDILSDIGALGVAGIVIWAMVTERLIPRGRLDDMKADRDRVIHALERERYAHDRPRSDTDPHP